ncbi:DUF3291 domain-containing protein [Thermobifida halotolerans]|uniref:DUF3291 domain-containing protein n=1 Tax=Thermobifida halotolerans TaxID=483545 RepID=A0AA97LTW0_9ACTN|nr:DUF3291 domain-containing protein [Thermobifida halotolerans]UOE17970.1 DUF3291 domain-containing protein [Thermobifida halotolerans]
MSTPLLHGPPRDTDTPFSVEGLRSDADLPPVLAAVQSISLPDGPSEALDGLVDALSRRAADHPGLVRAADAVTVAGGAVLLVTLWESIADLRAFVLDSGADTRSWRARTGLTPVSERALWWTCRQGTPDPAEARSRLARLRADGPGPHAFTLRSPVPPPR